MFLVGHLRVVSGVCPANMSSSSKSFFELSLESIPALGTDEPLSMDRDLSLDVRLSTEAKRSTELRLLIVLGSTSGALSRVRVTGSVGSLMPESLKARTLFRWRDEYMQKNVKLCCYSNLFAIRFS